MLPTDSWWIPFLLHLNTDFEAAGLFPMQFFLSAVPKQLKNNHLFSASIPQFKHFIFYYFLIEFPRLHV